MVKIEFHAPETTTLGLATVILVADAVLFATFQSLDAFGIRNCKSRRNEIYSEAKFLSSDIARWLYSCMSDCR